MEDGLKVAKRPSPRTTLVPGAPGTPALPNRSKHDIRQPLSVDTAVGRENRRAETAYNRRNGRAARRFQLVNHIVRI